MTSAKCPYMAICLKTAPIAMYMASNLTGGQGCKFIAVATLLTEIRLSHLGLNGAKVRSGVIVLYYSI